MLIFRISYIESFDIHFYHSLETRRREALHLIDHIQTHGTYTTVRQGFETKQRIFAFHIALKTHTTTAIS